MSDQELCDALVEDGILTCHGVPKSQRGVSARPVYSFDNRLEQKSPELWIEDWRVAGACLERMTEQEIYNEISAGTVRFVGLGWIKKPRAIITAYVEARK